MTIRVTTCGVVLLLAAGSVGRAAITTETGFDRYQVILDRAPFGVEAPPDTGVSEDALRDAKELASDIRLTGLIGEGERRRIGIVVKSTNESFLLNVGDIEAGIELVSVDFEKEEATIKRGEGMAVIKLETGDITPVTGNSPGPAAPPRVAGPVGRPMPAGIRRPGSTPRRPAPPISPDALPKPKYEGAELKRHLEDYNEEVIRAGMPPLPVTLRPDQDDRLVNEGVLPPQ